MIVIAMSLEDVARELRQRALHLNVHFSAAEFGVSTPWMVTLSAATAGLSFGHGQTLDEAVQRAFAAFDALPEGKAK